MWNGDGGGIALFGAGTPTVENNLIVGNIASGLSPARGGGIFLEDTSGLIAQNVIYGNAVLNGGPPQGSGIYLSIAAGGTPSVINNTVIGDASVTLGSAVYAIGTDSGITFYNNILVGPNGQNAVYCDPQNVGYSPVFGNNDAFSSGGTGLAGACSSQGTQNGNISVDPFFVNSAAANFRLQTTSPAIDAGTNAAPNLPQTDFAGNPRILDGNNDCVSTIDMGAYELARISNATLSPTSLIFPSQLLGTTSSASTVTLSNSGATCFQFSGFGTTGDYAQNSTCSAAGLRAGSSCAFSVTFNPTTLGKRLGALNISGTDGTSSRNLSTSLLGIGVDFSVGVSPTSVSVHAGRPVTLAVSVTSLAGKVRNSVALSCSGLPSYSSCTFSPASVTPGDQVATSTLTIAVGKKAPLGNFNVLINGTSGSVVHSASLLLAIY